MQVSSRSAGSFSHLGYLFTWHLRRYCVVLAICGFCFLSLASARPVLAFDQPPDPVVDAMAYTVVPGDTLTGIAERYGTNLHALMQKNSIASPANIYPGQVVLIPNAGPSTMLSLKHSFLAYSETWLDLSHRTGVIWEQLALVNRILNPTVVVPGYALIVPGGGENTLALSSAPMSALEIAVIYQVPYWVVLRLNPYPRLSAEPFVISPNRIEIHNSKLPPPLTGVLVSQQPLIRGTALGVTVLSTQPIECSLSFLEQVVPCYADSDLDGDTWSYTALLGLSPLLDPGLYTATLQGKLDSEPAFDLPVPMLVSAGRYDYERIDLPPDRESLLDPALSQIESNKIATLRTLRTPDRLWQLPFTLPLPGSITSYYGSRRSYGYGFGSFHGGTDFRARLGTPVSAPEAGTVVLAEPLVVRGNAVIIDHGWGVMTGYWHLSRIDVTIGQMVDRGDMLGAVGNTGLSTGPHLHWELWINGISVSPLAWANADSGLGAGE